MAKGKEMTTTKLPVLLIHGYMEDASVWNKWINLLKNDGISAVYPITFKQSDDKCGSAADTMQKNYQI